jgi:membrane protease YdiL (CAAX protease family)
LQVSEHGGVGPRLESRLLAWGVFVGALIALAYGSLLAGGDRPANLLYKWSTAVGGAIEYAVMLAIVWALARGLGRDLLGLRRPASWSRAAGLFAGALIAIWTASALLGLVLKAGKEQGLVPDRWDASRAAPFVANFVVVALLAPVCEELLFRGLGFGLVSAVTGPWPGIVISGLAFGLAHGLVAALPVLALFGIILGWLRWKTGSIYPGMLVHGTFNGVSLILAVTL